jgi:ABC-2 type transport system ATP-binding protein
MRRRLDLAASLIKAPPVLFLDEPTTGLDPRGRNEVWQAIRALVATGTTVLLTTQYLEEADQLAGRIAVIDSGRVIAAGTPDELKADLSADRIHLVLRREGDLPTATGIVKTVGTPEVDADNRRISAHVKDRVEAITQVAQALQAASIDIEDIGVRRPTLDEVFLTLTGKEAAA